MNAFIIGRFQPLHAGHISMIEYAKKKYKKCLIIVGSAKQATCCKSPIPYNQVIKLIENITHLPVIGVPDFIDNAKWIQYIKTTVKNHFNGEDATLITCNKDINSHYHHHQFFEKCDIFKQQIDISATEIRQHISQLNDIKNNTDIEIYTKFLPANVRQYLDDNHKILQKRINQSQNMQHLNTDFNVNDDKQLDNQNNNSKPSGNHTINNPESDINSSINAYKKFMISAIYFMITYQQDNNQYASGKQDNNQYASEKSNAQNPHQNIQYDTQNIEQYILLCNALPCNDADAEYYNMPSCLVHAHEAMHNIEHQILNTLHELPIPTIPTASNPTIPTASNSKNIGLYSYNPHNNNTESHISSKCTSAPSMSSTTYISHTCAINYAIKARYFYDIQHHINTNSSRIGYHITHINIHSDSSNAIHNTDYDYNDCINKSDGMINAQFKHDKTKRIKSPNPDKDNIDNTVSTKSTLYNRTLIMPESSKWFNAQDMPSMQYPQNQILHDILYNNGNDAYIKCIF